jgi:hypothetical protein
MAAPVPRRERHIALIPLLATSFCAHLVASELPALGRQGNLVPPESSSG